MEYKTLKFEKDGPIGVLTLNRPESRNSINFEMRDELTAFWRDRLGDFDTRVIVLTGAGKGFCSGIDTRESAEKMPAGGYTSKSAYELQKTYSEMILLMRKVPQPIIGAVNGAAAGGGFSFALASDVRIVAPEAFFFAAYINIGLGGADMGSSWLFTRSVGFANASRYLLTGDRFGAEEALRMGMVQAVHPREKLMEEAMKIARTMTEKSPLGLRLTKEAINCNIGGASLEEAVMLEDRNQSLLITQLSNPGSQS